ncbi:LANO_0G08812g1_1 [Lachancea nothofagi CBS 11611]|uniref:Ribosomal RNA-processing protein 42 n=1 Tax=Lachancea nothofagi CBS 11611 TaxID=1266666 RepID=A0A1G4KI03_9SACH|nr:LANO_0G08812g1_1 [Lachancea nothofagi CBS 11611]
MVLSITEKLYLHESLASKPPARPDGRNADQFRPIEIFTDFLPTSNGSSKIVASDGTECIVSIKCKVVDRAVEEELVVVDVDIAGHRDDSTLVQGIASILNRLLVSQMDQMSLRLTKKYSFKLFIDVLVLSSYSHPLTLISLAIYSALNSTQLPTLISSDDDLDVAELPTFHDYDMSKLNVKVPLLFTLAICGKNVIVDPAASESDVANNGVLVTWNDGKVVAPVRTLGLNEDYVRGICPQSLVDSIRMVEELAPKILKALDN